ncbi:MAG: bifunctional riboflavin kinase/FAD synthetase [Candidatus Desulfofervidus auxilii]|nr:bifunctional riboflavin kinase/FAD synthetase [Candidatus Desulfofervidus auxilii]
MKVINSLEEIKKPFSKAVITIGNFDGVHLGHQSLFQKVKERAKIIKGTSIVITFDPHPVKVITGKHIPLITPLPRKLELIAAQGIEVTICLPFTKEFSQISAEEFVKEILIKKIGMKEIVIGYNYTFGRKREGNVELLKILGEKLGFKVHVIEPVMINGQIVSSSLVRELITAGKVDKVKDFLSRYYQVVGKVIPGHGRGGRLLGIPTANLALINEVFPKPGVYAVEVIYQKNRYQGVANIGFNPTFGNNTLSVETHILDFNENIYDKTIKLNFIKRLRDEKKFKSIQDLADQIKKDIEVAREILPPV